ncbi:MAG: hypothetical protein HRU03_04150 [Nanoarchaeales archaeon]|nr:hypothetical protein [Nanoarchaeales archaeon]
MFLSDLILTFSNGSFGFKISIILFILVLGLILTWGVFALVGLDEYRENRDELFKLISDIDLKKLNILASYNVFDRNVDVFFCESGVGVRNKLDLRFVSYDDILKEEFIRWLDLQTVSDKIPHSLKFQLKTTSKIKWLYGGQSLKIILPMDNEKKKIIISKLREILG